MNNRGVLLLGLLAIGVLDFLCIRMTQAGIEQDLLSRSAAVLEQNQIPPAGLSVNGRDALLSGIKGSLEVSDQARTLVGGVPGVRVVEINFLPGTLEPVRVVDPVQVKLDEALRDRTIAFAGQSAFLAPPGRAVLDRVIPILNASPGVAIEIRGPATRVASVKNYLASKGLASGRFSAAAGTEKIQFTVIGGK